MTDKNTPDTPITLTIDEDKQGIRLDSFLAEHMPDISRSRFKDIIKSGGISRNGSKTSPSQRLQQGDIITIAPIIAEDPEPKGEDIPLSITYEDEHLIVVDKPAGLVVHPGAGNWTGTLVNALIHHCGESLSGIGGIKRPGIVHRLDKDTSGLLVIAKNDKTHQGLSAQFADHGRTGPLKRQYKALVWGTLRPYKGTVETDIARAPNNRLKMAVTTRGGKKAITHYTADAAYYTEEGTPLFSLITCRLETGRTHQIRVHMTHIGNPLLRDTMYGSAFASKMNRLEAEQNNAAKSLQRQALHAYMLAFEHPITGENLHFESAIPSDMAPLVALTKK